MTRRNELILLPAVKAFRERAEPDRLWLTQKYLDGTVEIFRNWPGEVTTVLSVTEQRPTDFDLVEVVGGALGGTGLEIRPKSFERLVARLSKASMVLAFLNRQEAGLASPLKAAGIPLVYISEYSPRTERQILLTNGRNPILLGRRLLWQLRTNHYRNRAVALATGLQCSGVPTYEYYRNIQQNRVLFFDNRVRKGELATEKALIKKFSNLNSGRPLKLVYGGRFVPMKGVMDLPLVAASLREAGVHCQFDIFGDGPLRPALEARISEFNLENIMRLRAPVDFRNGWTRVLSEETDIFVCCHAQGDPSSTYIEAMSCGVPIVSYDNEAFVGLVRQSMAGWLVTTGRPNEMAAKIAELAVNRNSIIASARTGLKFARQNSFENTFKARTDHLISLSRFS